MLCDDASASAGASSNGPAEAARLGGAGQGVKERRVLYWNMNNSLKETPMVYV